MAQYAQFLSRDPAVATTREPYGYSGDNPLNGSDPAGLYPAPPPGYYSGWGNISGGGPISESTMWNAIEQYLGPDYYEVNASNPDNLIFRSKAWPDRQARYDFGEDELHFEVVGGGENAHVRVIPNNPQPSPSPSPSPPGGCGGAPGGGTTLSGCYFPGPAPEPLPFPEPGPVLEPWFAFADYYTGDNPCNFGL